MDDPLLVRRLERLCDLLRDLQRLVNRDRAFRDPIGQRRSVDQLHYKSSGVRALLQTIDRRDVRVIE